MEGPSLRVPVTVALPQPLDVAPSDNGCKGDAEPSIDLGVLQFVSGQELRRFVQGAKCLMCVVRHYDETLFKSLP